MTSTENRRDCPCGPVERNDWPRRKTTQTAPTPGRGAEERASAEAAAAPALQRRQLLVGAGDLAAATGNPVRTRVTLASGFDGEPPRLESVHEGRHDSPCRGPLRTGFTAACRAPENTSRTRRPQLHAVLVRRRRGAGSRTRSHGRLRTSRSDRNHSRSWRVRRAVWIGRPYTLRETTGRSGRLSELPTRARDNTCRSRPPRFPAMRMRRRRGVGSRTRSFSGLRAPRSVRSRSRGRRVRWAVGVGRPFMLREMTGFFGRPSKLPGQQAAVLGITRAGQKV